MFWTTELASTGWIQSPPSPIGSSGARGVNTSQPPSHPAAITRTSRFSIGGGRYIWVLICGIGCQLSVFSFQSLVFGRWYLVVGIWSLVFGRWYLVFGLWSLVFGLAMSFEL